MAVLPYVDDTPVLEIGFGTGHLQAKLAALDIQVFGLDESPQMLELTKKRLRNQKSDLKIVRGLAQRLPFQSRSFKRVVSTFPSEYIIEETTLREIWRVLDTEGKAVILPVAWIQNESLLHRAAAWLFKFTGEAPQKSRYLETRYPFFQSSLQDAGFQVRHEIIQEQDCEILVILATKD